MVSCRRKKKHVRKHDFWNNNKKKKKNTHKLAVGKWKKRQKQKRFVLTFDVVIIIIMISINYTRISVKFECYTIYVRDILIMFIVTFPSRFLIKRNDTIFNIIISCYY